MDVVGRIPKYGTALLVVAAVIGVGIRLAATHASTTITFTPQPLSIATTEVPNPTRGLNKWNGNELAPQPEPSRTVYQRYSWSELEPSMGVYDFSRIEAAAQDARNRGGKFGFRVMAYCSSWCPDATPQYIRDRPSKGWWVNAEGRTEYVPDWNDPYFLDRQKALISELGRRYNNDVRFDLSDIGFYGNWGEWHTWPLAYPSYTGAEDITVASMKRIIDDHVAAFSNQRLAISYGGRHVAEGIKYAMSLRPAGGAISWRNDCLGTSHFESMTTMAQWPSMAEQWKIAPVVTEACYQNPGTGGWALARDQVKAHHVALVGNGNSRPFAEFSTAEKDAWLAAGRFSGYRFRIGSLTMPATIQPSTQFTVSAQWVNEGVTPAYDPWRVMYQLRDPTTGGVVWRSGSSVNLQSLLPTGLSPHAAHDTFTVPSTVAAGQYDMVVVIEDTKNYFKPMSLAITGKRADGSYALGKVTVGTAGTAPAPSPTPEPTTDTQAPQPASNVRTTTVTSSSVALAWNAALDNVGVTKYEVWRGDTAYANWVLAGSVAGTTLAYTDNSLQAGTSYTYGIRAFDAAGSRSESSNVIIVRTAAAVSTALPGDVNGDNRVNAVDLSVVLSRDGQNYAPADFNKDGTVGAADMAILLGKWTW